MPPQQQIDGALGVGDFGRGELPLAILPGKTARLQQRVAVAQGQTERGRQLQQDVAAARGLAGFDVAQMLDRDAGLERQIGLAHGAAVAPAAQEVADGIDGWRRMLARVHAPIMRRERGGVNASQRRA